MTDNLAADPHFNWTKLIPGVGHDYPHVATLAIVCALIILFSIAANLALRAKKDPIQPETRLGIRGLAEVMVEFSVGMVDMVLGPQHRNMVPMYGALFFFILLNNLMAMVPGMTPATDNFNTTAAVGVFSFLVYNYLGLKTNGVTYLKHFMGPVWWLAPLMIVIEIVSHLVRPLSLSVRLMGNMQGDHAVVSTFLALVPIGVPIPFYALGLFVCIIQAFVFTLLSMVYVSMATEHEEEH